MTRCLIVVSPTRTGRYSKGGYGAFTESVGGDCGEIRPRAAADPIEVVNLNRFVPRPENHDRKLTPTEPAERARLPPLPAAAAKWPARRR